MTALSATFRTCGSLLQQAQPSSQFIKQGCRITLVALAIFFISASVCRYLSCPPVAVIPIAIGSALLASWVAWRTLQPRSVDKRMLEQAYSVKLTRQREQVHNLKKSYEVLNGLFTLDQSSFDARGFQMTASLKEYYDTWYYRVSHTEKGKQLVQLSEKWDRQKAVIARIVSDWERSLEQGVPVSIPKWYHCSTSVQEIVESGSIQPRHVPLFCGFEDINEDGLVCVSINIERRYGRPIALSEDIEGLAAPKQIGIQEDQSGAFISAPGWFGIPKPIPLFNRSTDPVGKYNNHPVCFLSEEDTSVTSSSIKKIPSEALDVLHALLRLHNEIPAEWSKLPLWLRVPE